jgi:hypothetical protein
MLIRRACAYAKADGQPCRMAPLHERPYCFAHDPERAEEAAEARRLGGLRRKGNQQLMRKLTVFFTAGHFKATTFVPADGDFPIADDMARANE